MNFSSLLNRSLFLSNPVFQKVISSVIGSSAWLVEALPLEVYRSKSKRLRSLVNEISDEISQYRKKPTHKRTKEALKIVLINLWIGVYFQKPIRYSRDKSAYASARRYGKLFFKYDRLIPVIDVMEELGLLYQKKGFFIFDKEFGFQTRMWASEKLIKRFEAAGLCEYGFFNVVQPNEPIILKDDKKNKVHYLDTPKIIRQREQLKKYNNFIDSSNITVVLNSEVTISIRFLVLFLYQYIIKNTVKINSVNLIKLDQLNQNYKQYQFNNNFIYYHYYLLSMTQEKQRKHLLAKAIDDYSGVDMLYNYMTDLNAIVRGFDNSKDADWLLNQQSLLKDIGVEKLEFQLVYEFLHRVYNRKSFNCGGRATGALHINIPSYMRPFIHIGGQETVELDFSAFHILMLYHMEGIDYREDPYTVCEGLKMRAIYKVVGLISINAKNDKSAFGAIRKKLEKKGLSLPNRPKPLVSLVKTFKKAHEPIKKYLSSDIGTRLQNKDSDIMNAILIRLMEMDIVGLSVYDSVIIQAQYKDILEGIMIEEYEKQMGFKPVVDIK